MPRKAKTPDMIAEVDPGTNSTTALAWYYGAHTLATVDLERLQRAFGIIVNETTLLRILDRETPAPAAKDKVLL